MPRDMESLRVFPSMTLTKWKNEKDENINEMQNLAIHKRDGASPKRQAHVHNYDVGISLQQILNKTPQCIRRTKIICAIGPSCSSQEMLGKLLDAGMNVARLNLSHGDITTHQETLQNLRVALEQRPGNYCAVLVDTKGPEIRTGFLKNHAPVQLKADEMIEITTDYSIEGDCNKIACNLPQLPSLVSPGSRILCDDGNLILEVVTCHETYVEARITNTYLLEEKKNMHLPGANLVTSGITETDCKDIANFVLPNHIDIVSCSLIRSAEDLRHIRRLLGPIGSQIRVHAKIESIEALRHFDEILNEADGVHVSRGDLGMELSPEQIFLAQKMIIRKANIAGKPVVTSTQMLQSMTEHPIPSFAECSDVANAVIDGTDAVMLSSETAKGKFPIQAVLTMSRICIEAEGSLDYPQLYKKLWHAIPRPVTMVEAMASSAVEIAIDVKAKLIVCLSESGYTAKMVAKYRPQVPILMVTASETTAHQLHGLSRNCFSLQVPSMLGTESLIVCAIDFAKKQIWIANGDVVVVLHGLYEGVPGKTNVIKVIEANASGFISPMHQQTGGYV